jgi:HAD superfamily hydrolase (TIGR01549 family)
MKKVKIVSFDVDGTLVTPDFSYAVWFEGIPSLYAKRNGISFQEAKAFVDKEYRAIGDHKIEWYDIRYWFQRFGLSGYQQVLEDYRHRVSCYPEVTSVLSSLNKDYILIVISSSTREFLPYLLDSIKGYFPRVFSSVSDFEQIKTPKFYLEVCQQMSVIPEEVAHVGDIWELDFLAAREAGINAFHLDREKKRQEGSSLISLTDLEAKLLDT